MKCSGTRYQHCKWEGFAPGSKATKGVWAPVGSPWCCISPCPRCRPQHCPVPVSPSPSCWHLEQHTETFWDAAGMSQEVHVLFRLVPACSLADRAGLGDSGSWGQAGYGARSPWAMGQSPPSSAASSCGDSAPWAEPGRSGSGAVILAGVWAAALLPAHSCSCGWREAGTPRPDLLSTPESAGDARPAWGFGPGPLHGKALANFGAF